MRWNSLFASILATVLLPCCNVFLTDMGGLDEQCAGNGDCMGDLVCNFNECGEPASDGEQCDEEQQWNGQILVCEDGLWCVDNKCVEAGGEGEPCGLFGGYVNYAGEDTTVGCDDGLYCIEGICLQAGGEGQLCLNYDEGDDEGDCDTGLRCVDEICEAPTDVDEVKQPNANLYWLLCPLGCPWDGWECSGDDDCMLGCYGEDAQSACPSSYRLPTRSEMLVLLAGCDADVIAGEYGYCNSCEESGNCSVMFEQFYDNKFWTSTEIFDRYWWADFGDGHIRNISSYNDVRCVRSGD